MIEVLKSHALTYEEISNQIEQNNVDQIAQQYEVDMAQLKALYEASPVEFKDAFQGHYEVKFMTINGLKNLIRMRFGITEDRYTLLEQGNGIENLIIDEATEKQITTMLSSNWKVKRDDKKVTFYV